MQFIQPSTVKWFVSIVYLTILSAWPAIAQYEEKDFVRYTVRDGLSDNYITCLQQDDWGYIWAGTNNGLNQFDGNSFKKYFQASSTLPLASIDIRNLKKFGPHQLGIISGGGLEILNTKTFSLSRFYIKDSTSFSTYLNGAWDATPIEGQRYAMTTSAGFYIFRNDGAIDFRHDGFKPQDVGQKRILYGHDIFRLDEKQHIVYYGGTGMALYDDKKKVYTELGPQSEEYKFLAHPDQSKGDRWLSKYQWSDHEFIFIHFKKDSIAYYDHRNKKLVLSPLKGPLETLFSWESKILKLNDSSFLVNDRTKGFHRFHLDRSTGKITMGREHFLPSYKIIRMFLDKDQRLWIASSEGLLHQKINATFITATRFTPSTGDRITGGFSCTYRHGNKLYAGRFLMNKGLVVFDPTTLSIVKEISFFDGNNNWNEVRSMELYHPDTLWIGTNGGLIWYDTKTDRYGKLFDETKDPWASGFCGILAPPNKDGFAWIVNHLDGMVVRYHVASHQFKVFSSDTKPALPFEKVKNVAYDSYGDVWIGGHSLTRWNTKLEIFDTLITVYGGPNKFHDDILTLTADNKGSLWMHNAFNGLLEYKIREKKFVSYTMKDGLPSDALQAFSTILGESLWVGSNSQLFEFNTHTKKVIAFDQDDGLPEHKPTGRKLYFDALGGMMYLCYNEFLVRFPVRHQQSPDNSSELVIQEVVINNDRSFMQPLGDITLDHNENNLALKYTIIDFEKNNYQFAYRLDPSANWTVLGSQRSLNLSNLQPGKYHIELKALGKSGNEKFREFDFIIKPPIWKTTWFIILTGIVLATGLYFFYRRRVRHIRQKANLDRLLAQTELKALHSQMNPHFIFNSLNSIREMILNNENKEASHYLSKFAQLIRITLDQSGQSFISLRNAMDYLQRYIEMEKIRNEHFKCDIHADPSLDPDETLLPPMLIQPFIENAIWHGATGSKKEICIEVRFEKKNGQLVCTIEDDGIGIAQAEANKNLTANRENGDRHHSVGISNIRQRIHLLNEKHNLRSSVSIEDKKNIPGANLPGTLVTLHLSLETNEE